MAVRKTQQQFIAESIAKHGDAYDYSKAVYKGAFEKVILRCKKHDKEFYMSAKKHTSGQGCVICAHEKIGKHNSGDAPDTFVQKAMNVHGIKYDYSKVVYVNCKKKVIIGCKTCGREFLQTPSDHLKGGCLKCASDERGTRCRLSTDEFIRKAKAVHGDTYDYSLVAYKTGRHKVPIICKEHHTFNMQPDNHLYGQGCPACAVNGYRKSVPGCLYILVCGDLTKVGITNKGPSVRAKAINKSSGFNFKEVFSIKFEDGRIPAEIETRVLRELRNIYRLPVEKFDGSTETFLDVNRTALINRIEELVSQLQAEGNTELAKAA